MLRVPQTDACGLLPCGRTRGIAARMASLLVGLFTQVRSPKTRAAIAAAVICGSKVSKGWPYMVVLEDDVAVPDGFRQKTCRVIENEVGRVRMQVYSRARAPAHLGSHTRGTLVWACMYVPRIELTTRPCLHGTQPSNVSTTKTCWSGHMHACACHWLVRQPVNPRTRPHAQVMHAHRHTRTSVRARTYTRAPAPHSMCMRAANLCQALSRRMKNGTLPTVDMDTALCRTVGPGILMKGFTQTCMDECTQGTAGSTLRQGWPRSRLRPAWQMQTGRRTS